MLNELPNTFVSVQYHTSGSGNFAWANTRWHYYYQSGDGVPLTWFDAAVKRLGAQPTDEQQYTWYMSAYNTRHAVATDVSLALTAVQTSTNTYQLGVTVSQDAGGVAKTVIVHVLQLLDKYPSSTDLRYRNCGRQHLEQLVSLTPGTSQTFNVSFTLAATAVANLQNVKFLAFAQIPSTTRQPIWNATYIGYPFPQPSVMGDVDGDLDVDLADLAALLATYGLCEGDTGYVEAADFEDNDCIDLADLAALLSNYGYGG